MLRIVDLVKRYPTGDLAFEGARIEVPDDQEMALIGPSGRRQVDAGPSTPTRAGRRRTTGASLRSSRDSEWR